MDARRENTNFTVKEITLKNQGNFLTIDLLVSHSWFLIKKSVVCSILRFL